MLFANFPGRDDKYWAGHFGPWASNAVVRVKTDTSPAEDDEKCDVVENELSPAQIQRITEVIGSLNEHYCEGMKDVQAATGTHNDNFDKEITDFYLPPTLLKKTHSLGYECFIVILSDDNK